MYSLFNWFTQLATQTNVIDAFCYSQGMARTKRPHSGLLFLPCQCVKGFSAKTKSKIAYPNLDSARRPVPHDASLPVPLPPHGGLEFVPDEVEDSAAEGSSTDPSNSAESEYEPEESSKPILFSQKGLNDLIKDLSLC